MKQKIKNWECQIREMMLYNSSIQGQLDFVRSLLKQAKEKGYEEGYEEGLFVAIEGFRGDLPKILEQAKKEERERIKAEFLSKARMIASSLKGKKDEWLIEKEDFNKIIKYGEDYDKYTNFNR